MKVPTLHTLVVGFLGIAFLGCVAVIGALALTERPNPDLLGYVTTGILGLLGGILVPSKSEPVGGTLNIYREAGAHRAEGGHVSLVTVAAVLVIVVCLVILL